jgi:hypothetical protein
VSREVCRNPPTTTRSLSFTGRNWLPKVAQNESRPALIRAQPVLGENSDFDVVFEVQRATAEVLFYGDRPDDEGVSI